MTNLEPAELVHCDFKGASYSRICIDKPEFNIGRSKDASFPILSLLVSKTQCVFQNKNENWTLCDKSTYGTYVNKVKLEKDVPLDISDGDFIELGVSGRFKFTFHTSGSVPNKRKKPNEEEASQQTQEEGKNVTVEGSEDKSMTEESLHVDNKLLEDEVKRIEKFLEEKKKEEELLNQNGEEKGIHRSQDSEPLVNSRKAKLRAILDVCKTAVDWKKREDDCIKQLEKYKNELENKLDNPIEGELSKCVNTEKVKELIEEIEKIRMELKNIEKKKDDMERELDEMHTRGDKLDEHYLQGKQETIQFMEEMMETELQCSICSEVFIEATILNCAHAFCNYCINQWNKKKTDCPVCRTKISTVSRLLALDNFVDKVVSSLSDEKKKIRQEMVKERQAFKKEEKVVNRKKGAHSSTRTRRQRRRERYQTSSTRVSSSTPRPDSRRTRTITSRHDSPNTSSTTSRYGSASIATPRHDSPSTSNTTSRHDSPSTSNTTSRHDSPSTSTTTSRHDFPSTSTTTSRHDSPSTSTTTSRHDSPSTGTTTSSHDSPSTSNTTSRHDSPSTSTTISRHDFPSTSTTTSRHDSPSTSTTTLRHDSPSTSTTTLRHDSPSTSTTTLRHDSPSTSNTTATQGGVAGVPGAYYGGYGYCFRCGRKGHWSVGCPERI